MSSNLFGRSGGGGGVGGLSPRPSINDTFGLRQRNNNNVHSKLSASDNNKSNIERENSHPNNHNTLNKNNKNKNVQTYGKWGSSMSNVRAPPRMSLSVGGKYATPNRNNVASASNHQQHKTNNIEMNTSNNRTATQSSSIVSLNETPDYISNTKIIEYKSKIRTEADIMLYPDDDELYNTNNGIESTLDSLCERLLGWFFFWDTSQSY